MKKVTPFLMFQRGVAEDAILFYTSIIEDSKVNEIIRFKDTEPGETGALKQATFTLKNQTFLCLNSYIEHDFDFTPAFSIFLDCDSAEEIDYLYHSLVANGKVLMPLDQYDFSKKFTWISDQYGISWQLNLPE